MGSFIILVTALAFVAGKLRNELALTLLGTVFLTVLAYCFLGVFFMGLLHRRKARLVSMIITSETVTVGREGELSIRTGGGSSPGIRAGTGKYRFRRLPAILIRCELRLETRDGRVIRHYTDPDVDDYSRFPVKERGAFYGNRDSFVIFDAPGFFRLSLPLPRNGSPRLLASPVPAEEPIPLSLNSGGTEQRNEPHYRKSDELTDHRPYIPGDDPRRINWKLYGHAPLGELFVREGEPEPPPHSRLLILVDTEADRSLYTLDEARRAVDLLCANTLTAALEFSAQGMDILIGYTGGKIIGGKEESGPLNAADLAAALAWPFAVPWPEDAPGTEGKLPVPQREIIDFAKIPRDRGVLIFALPRAFAGTPASSSMERFLKNREPRPGTDILFLYDAESGKAAELEDAARVCVNLYNGRPGVYARKIAVPRSGKTAPVSEVSAVSAASGRNGGVSR